MGNFLQRQNWWKIGFFLALFLFEITRELYVAAEADDTRVAGSFTVINVQGLTTAEGRWRRIDGGGSLIPAAVRIECWQEDQECTEAYSTAYDGAVMPPEIDHFPATFAPGLITYENNRPACASYSVKIDTAHQQVIAIRQKKEKTDMAFNCNILEKRIEMRLGSGYEDVDSEESWRQLTNDHFVPLIQLIGWITKRAT